MTRIYVGGIPTDCRERDLDKFFRNYGRLRDCLIKNGYAFVEFEDNRDADDAVYEMNGRELLGCRVSVEHARGIPRRGEVMGAGASRRPPAWTDRYGPPMRTPYRVIVENLSSRISWQDLKDYMRKEADVTFADAHRHARNEGIVEFASYSDMKRAIDRLDDTELMGRRIKMVDDYRKSRSRSRRRSRSRSRSKRRHSYSSSRSRSRSKRRSRSRSRSRRDRSRSRSQSRGSKRSRSPAKENSKSRSRSPSQKKDEAEKANGSYEQNGKRSRSRSRSKSRSPRSDRRSPSPKRARNSRSRSNERGRSRSRSYRSRSRSRSEERNGGD